MASERILVAFRKVDSARFLSHLDLLATWEYALRRATLPVALSEGFNPRPRISLAAPLATGHAGEHELIEITLHEPLDSVELLRRISGSLPHGIEPFAVQPVREGTRPVAARVQAVRYRVELPEPAPNLAGRCAELTSRPELMVEEERDGRVRRRDLAPLIRSLDAPDDVTIRLSAAQRDGATLRPERLVELLGLDPAAPRYVRQYLELAEPD